MCRVLSEIKGRAVQSSGRRAFHAEGTKSECRGPETECAGPVGLECRALSAGGRDLDFILNEVENHGGLREDMQHGLMDVSFL